MHPTLRATNLKKIIGKRTIVENVTFEVMPGEVFGFLGPNGAGKTTTIRMLVGLIRPTAGSVEICGFDVRRQFEEAMRCIGCIVETPDLYRFMSGRENLEHFSRMIGAIDHRRIDEVATLVQMADRLDDRVGTYSLGMRQRLGIAQALLGKPRLLILDEPANGLDPAGIREMRSLIRTLAREEGMSVFISSHLLAEIELMCDRVAIIHRGRVLESGKVSDLIASNRGMEFRVDDVAAAMRQFDSLNLDAAVDGDIITVQIEESMTPPIVASLAAAGVSIFHVQPRLQTLEEMFLEATGGETVGMHQENAR